MTKIKWKYQSHAQKCHSRQEIVWQKSRFSVYHSLFWHRGLQTDSHIILWALPLCFFKWRWCWNYAIQHNSMNPFAWSMDRRWVIEGGQLASRGSWTFILYKHSRWQYSLLIWKHCVLDCFPGAHFFFQFISEPAWLTESCWPSAGWSLDTGHEVSWTLRGCVPV